MKVKRILPFILLIIILQFSTGCFRFDNSTAPATVHTFVNALINKDKSTINKLLSPDLQAQSIVQELAPWFDGKDPNNIMFTKKEYEEGVTDQPYVAIIRPDPFQPLTTLYLTVVPGTKGYVITKYDFQHE